MFHNANKLSPNPCICDRIVSATAAGSGNNSFSDSLKTELDSHASLWCLGGTHSFLRRLGSWICPKCASVTAMKCVDSWTKIEGLHANMQLVACARNSPKLWSWRVFSHVACMLHKSCAYHASIAHKNYASVFHCRC